MTRRLVPFLTAALLLMVPSVASAHTAAADLGCLVPHPVLTVDLVDYQGAHVTIAVDHVLVVDTDFASSFHTTRNVGSPLVAHTAQVVVTASDGEQYDRTFDLSSPPCKVVHELAPKASIAPWCGDPMTRYTLVNPTSHLVSFVIARRDKGVWLRLVRSVGAHRTFVTRYKHVDPYTITRVYDGRVVLAEAHSPKGGNYGRCLK